MRIRWIAVFLACCIIPRAFGGEEEKKAAPAAEEKAPAAEEKAPAKADENAPAKPEEKVELKSTQEKVSYGIGLSIGKNLKSQSIELDLKAFMKGIQDALSGGKTLLTEKEVREVMMAFQKEMMEKQADRSKTLGEKNQKEGEAFLAENMKKPGVETLPSGLQYRVLQAGGGAKPKATDTVVTHYRGTLIDGTEFDSSYSRGEPATFQVGGVIKGWTEALQLMPVGSKWQLFIPSGIAYGARGAGQNIGPNATLIFEVELLEIKASK